MTLGHAPADGRMVSLGAPFWWRGQGAGHRWSLTGRLLGPRFDNNRGSGGAAGFQSGLTRTLAGLESALSYSRSAGKGKHGRTPDLLRQVRKGGAGPDTFIPWRALLSLAGGRPRREEVMRPRYQRQLAGQDVDDDLIVPTCGLSIRRGRSHGLPRRSLKTSPPTSAASQIPLFHRCFAARPLLPTGERQGQCRRGRPHTLLLSQWSGGPRVAGVSVTI